MALDELEYSIARELAKILPPGFSARASEEGVVVVSPSGEQVIPFALNVAANMRLGSSPQEAILQAAGALLARVQDDVVERLSEVWPAEEAEGRTTLGSPACGLEDGTLRMWFEDSHCRRLTEEVSVVVAPPTDQEVERILSRRAVPVASSDPSRLLPITEDND